MASIVVCGGSIIGLATGLLLARDGHAVTILEHDPAPVPDTASAAWESWNRSGVPQFHQPHNLFPRSRHILEAELPEVLAAMLADGCTWVDMLASKPPAIADDVRTDDDRFRFVTGRRPVLEHAVATVTENVAGITVRRGVRVRGLLTGPDVAPGVPHVVGVDTDTGEFRADLVIDAMGRKSPLVDWLAALGGPPVELQSSDAGFIYYTRYFTGPEIPVQIGPPLNHFGSFSLLTVTDDNATWSTTVVGRQRQTLRSRNCATRRSSSRSSGPARCRRTGTTARRSPRCCRWPACSTASVGSSSTSVQLSPGSSRSVTPGPAPTPRPAGA